MSVSQEKESIHKEKSYGVKHLCKLYTWEKINIHYIWRTPNTKVKNTINSIKTLAVDLTKSLNQKKKEKEKEKC